MKTERKVQGPSVKREDRARRASTRNGARIARGISIMDSGGEGGVTVFVNCEIAVLGL